MAIQTSPIVAITSGTVVLLVLGSIYTFGALTPYIASYLYYYGDPTSTTALSILFTAALIFTNLGQIASSALSAKLSNRALCFIAIFCISGSIFIVSFLKTFISYVIFYGMIYGFSIGIGYLPPVKNAYLHLPNRKGLVAGICMSGFGLSSVIFNQIIVAIVNPNDIPVDHDTKLFPKQVADNLPLALRVLGGCFFVAGSIASFFIYAPKNRDTIFSQTMISEENYDNNQIMQQITDEKNALKEYCNKKVYYLTIYLACIMPFGVFMASNYKDFAFHMNPQFQDKDHLITILGSIGIFSNGIFRSMWGILFDKFSYRLLSNIINIILFICCCLMMLAVKWFYSYLVLVLLVYMSYGGMYALMPTHTVRILGQKSGTKIYWAVFGGFSLAAILQFSLRYLIIQKLGDQGYIYCIIIFGVLSLVGLVINQVAKFKYQ